MTLWHLLMSTSSGRRVLARARADMDRIEHPERALMHAAYRRRRRARKRKARR